VCRAWDGIECKISAGKGRAFHGKKWRGWAGTPSPGYGSRSSLPIGAKLAWPWSPGGARPLVPQNPRGLPFAAPPQPNLSLFSLHIENNRAVPLRLSVTLALPSPQRKTGGFPRPRGHSFGSPIQSFSFFNCIANPAFSPGDRLTTVCGTRVICRLYVADEVGRGCDASKREEQTAARDINNYSSELRAWSGQQSMCAVRGACRKPPRRHQRGQWAIS
jgi:hypothetical protein